MNILPRLVTIFADSFQNDIFVPSLLCILVLRTLNTSFKTESYKERFIPSYQLTAVQPAWSL